MAARKKPAPVVLESSPLTLGEVTPLSEGELAALGYSRPAPAAAKEPEQGAFSRGFKRSFAELPQLAGGALAFAGDLAGSETVQRAGMRMYEGGKERVEKLSAPSDSLSNVLDGNGDWGDFLAGGAGYVAGQVLQSIGSGGVGALLARAASRKVVERQIAAVAADAAAKKVAQAAAEKTIARATTAGAVAGAGAQNLTMEAGSIYPEGLEEAVKEGRTLTLSDKGRMLAATIGAAGLDTVMEALTGSRVLKGTGGASLGGRLAREVPLGLAREVPTEVGQTAMERYGQGKPLTGAEANREYVDAGGLAVIGGGLGGGAAALHTAPQQPAAPGAGAAQPAPPAAVEPIAPPAPAAPAGPLTRAASKVGQGAMLAGAAQRAMAAQSDDAANAALARMEQQAQSDLAAQRSFGTEPDWQDPFAPGAQKPQPPAPAAATTTIAPPQESADVAPGPAVPPAVQGQAMGAGAPASDVVRPGLGDRAQAGDAVGAGAAELPAGGAPDVAADGAQGAPAAAANGGSAGAVTPAAPAPAVKQPEYVWRKNGEPFGTRTSAEYARTKMPNRGDGYEAVQIGGGGWVLKYGQVTPREAPGASAQAESPNAAGTPAESTDAPAGTAPGAHVSETRREAPNETAAGMSSPAEQRSTPSAAPEVKGEATPAVSTEQQPVPVKPGTVDEAAHQAATSPNNALPQPTEAQKESGTYRKGHTTVAGLDISIENPQGSRRRPEWPPLKSHYGYIKGTVGKDKDHIDIFVRPGTVADYDGPVFVIDQKNAKGGFDESKVMLGWPTRQVAERGYRENYKKGWDGIQSITKATLPDFREWLSSGDTKKPFAEHVKKQAAAAAAAENASAQPTPTSAAERTATPDTSAPASASADVSERAAPAEHAAPETKKAPRPRRSKKDPWAEHRAKLEAYFKPGAILKGYGGFDRVLQFKYDNGRFDVQVEHVQKDPQTGEWKTIEEPRWHSTEPNKRELAAGPVQAAPAPEPAAPASKEGSPSAAEPTPKSAGVQDVGEELRYNRRAAPKGLKWADVSGLNDALKIREVVKAKVWPKPDYEQLVASGRMPLSVHIVKQVYDSIAASPVVRSGKSPTDADLQLYIEGTERVRKAVDAWLADPMAQASVIANVLRSNRSQLSPEIREQAEQLIRAGAAIGNLTPLLDAVFPNLSAAGGFRGSKDANALAIVMGGNRFVRALQPGYKEMAKARDAVTGGWPAKQEAWQKQFDVREADMRARNVPGSEGTEGVVQRWQVYQKGSSALRGSKNTPVEGFATRDEAVEHARELVAAQRKDQGDEQGDLKGIPLEQVVRTGPPRRAEGENITPDRMQYEFGFRGINFGNWVNQAERQAHINAAYDALADLADLIGVPPRALSLGGTLGIAFGAQGNGGRAAAHFVPGVNEINITKTAGAGALAHEWAHALDHLLANQVGGEFARRDRPYLSDMPAKAEPGGLRPEVLAAVRTIVHAMRYRQETEAEAKARVQSMLENAQKRRDSWIRSLRRDIPEGKAAEFDALAERIKAGDLGDGVVQVSKAAFATPVPPRVAELRTAYKAATGRGADMVAIQQTGLNAAAVQRYQDATTDAHLPQRVDSEYYRASLTNESSSGQVKYWATPWEMFARAFEMYTTDRLIDRERRSDYLVSPGRDAATYRRGADNPYPKGVERTAINAAFDTLVGTLQTRDDDGKVTLFSRGESAGYAMPLEQVRAIAERTSKAWENGPRVAVIETLNDAPPVVQAEFAAQQERGALGQVEGFFHEGTVYLVADGLHEEADVARVLLHESLGHYGMHGAFGRALAPALDALIAARRDQVLAKAHEYGLDVSSKVDLRVAAEEVLAELAQTNPQLGFVQRAVSAVRALLRQLGFNLKLSDAEIVQRFIVPAGQFLRGQRAPSAPPPRTASPQVAAIFEGLASRGPTRTRAQALASQHPSAEAIRFVDANIMDLLGDLESAGKVEINCP